MNRIGQLKLPCGHMLDDALNTHTILWTCSRCAASFLARDLALHDDGDAVDVEPEIGDGDGDGDGFDIADALANVPQLGRVAMPCGHTVADVADLYADVWKCGKCMASLLVSDLMVVERQSLKRTT